MPPKPDARVPDASVVIPFRDAAPHVEACVRSVMEQATPFPFEVLAVDNASTDGGARLARAAGAEVLTEPREGSYAARNLGLHASRGAVVAFIDADCVAEPGWLAALVHALEDPDVSAAGTEIVGDPNQRELLARFARRGGVLSQRRRLGDPRGAYLQTASFALCRHDAAALGGFDDRLRHGGDADLCWRLASAHPRRRLHLIDTPLVRHHHRTSLPQLWRQYRAYGRGSHALSRIHPRGSATQVASLSLDAAKLATVPALTMVGLAASVWTRDPLPAVAPGLRAIQLLGKRTGELEAWLRS